MKFASAGVLVLGAVLALGTVAAAGEKPEAKDSPVVRKEVEVKKSETGVVKTQVEVRKNERELEAKLEAARERLEAAAREVAELSAELTGPMMHDKLMMRARPRAILGINVGESRSKEGVAIDGVSPGGAADKAGLKPGDVIVALDGRKLAGDGKAATRALIDHMRTVKPGGKVKVEYLREGRKESVEVETTHLARRFTRALPDGRLETYEVPTPAVPPMPPAQAFEFHGFPGHTMLDMELVTLTPKLGAYFGADKGVLVVRAPGKSTLKLEEGDVIVDIDGREPRSGSHALRILRSYQPGEQVTVNVLRNRKKMKIDATVPRNERMSWTMPLAEPQWLEDVTIDIQETFGGSPGKDASNRDSD